MKSVVDRMYRLIHTLRAGQSEAAPPQPGSSQSRRRATPADFESPGAPRRPQAQPNQSYSSQYGLQDTRPTLGPSLRARPPAFGQFGVQDTGYRRLLSPAASKSRNSSKQGQMGPDLSRRVELRHNFLDLRSASASEYSDGGRDRPGTSSRKRDVQASPYRTSRYGSRASNTDIRDQDNTKSIGYEQRQPHRDQQQSYTDHQMLPPALQTRSLHTKTNGTKTELADDRGTRITPSHSRSQASKRERRDRGSTTQSRERYRDRSRSLRRNQYGQSA